MNQDAERQWVDDAAGDAGTHERLVAAAGVHFRKFGYEKTTLAELAKSVGFSKAYFYRFFRSKQEIGEAVCSQCLGRITAEIEDEIDHLSSATEKLRKMLRTIPVTGKKLFLDERRLFEIAARSSREDWNSSDTYLSGLAGTLGTILREGREQGEFERKTALDEITRAILLAMRPFIDPNLLQYQIEFVPDGSNEVISLILRSLAP